MNGDDAGAGRRGLLRRLQAAGLALGCRRHEAAVARFKAELFRDLSGTVVELGPGTGDNLPYYPRTVRWIGIEPNLHMHPYLRREAARAGLAIDLRTGTAERLELPSASADAVVATLVLCSVNDVRVALAEVRRVLRPGGTFLFIEHVAAPRGSWTRRIQRALRPIWGIAGGGCRPDQETAALIEAAGFSSVTLEHFDVPLPVVGPHVAGRARR